MSFLTYLINGLSLGSVYALIALGYSMVYGIARMLNFAHGDIIMIGAYTAFSVVAAAGMPAPLGILSAVLACTILGVLIERLAYRPLRFAPGLAVLITAIGVSYFLQNAAQNIWGADSKFFPQNFFPTGVIRLGAFQISCLSLITIAVCMAIMLSVLFFIYHTRTGRAMRACSEDKGAAALMGINVNRMISLTFAIGSALAGIAAVLLASTYPSISPTMGSMPGIKAFTAAVLGGIGSIPGAFVGGLVLGVIEILAKAYISQQLADAIVFGVLIVILLLKPTGLLGDNRKEKV